MFACLDECTLDEVRSAKFDAAGTIPPKPASTSGAEIPKGISGSAKAAAPKEPEPIA